MNDSPRRTVGVLFSGGNAPGMNAFLRATVRLGINRYRSNVLGIKDGYSGLVRTCQKVADGELTRERIWSELKVYPGREGLWRPTQDIVCMDNASVSGLTGRGGIVLGAGRCAEFTEAVWRERIASLLKDLPVDSLFVVGGDGSLISARQVAEETGLRVIVVPATIDNDVACTHMSLGVDTAVNTLVWAIEHFGDTAGSHHRVMVLEIMGRDSGELARRAALATGTEIVVTPERGLMGHDKMQGIAGRLEKSMVRGRTHGIVLVSEGVKADFETQLSPVQLLANHLQEYFHRPASLFPDLEVRSSILGHLQRGGKPSAFDRLLAAQFAEAAWEAAMHEPPRSGSVGLRLGQICWQRLDAVSQSRHDDDAKQKLYDLQKAISEW